MKSLCGALGIAFAFCGMATVAPAMGNQDGNQVEIEAKTAPIQRDWRIELGTGVLFSNVRADNNIETGYTLIPATLTAGMSLDDVTLGNLLGGVLRGNSEFLFRGDGIAVAHGPESRLVGLSVGPRYNFVQPGWKIVPFVEGTVGILFADSNPILLGTPGSQNEGQHGLGQDFNFMFGVAVGARYDITEDISVRVAMEYLHVSNAGLSEPYMVNRPIDALGPRLELGYGF
jgi:opacity protein-like surface antigen